MIPKTFDFKKLALLYLSLFAFFFSIGVSVHSFADASGVPVAVAAASPAPVLAAGPVGQIAIPQIDVGSVLINLATNYRTLGVIGILSLLTLLSVQAIKSFVPDNFGYKRLITVGVSLLYSILSGLLIPGSQVASVIVTVFITSGGAMSLYEALKGAGVIKSPADATATASPSTPAK